MTKTVASGDRVAELLDEIASLPDASTRRLAEELVRAVTELYGAGMARVLELATSAFPPGRLQDEWADRLAADELVASLLVLHGLHPMPVRLRVAQALDGVRAALPGGDARILELDEAAGRLRLRLVSGSPFHGAIERRLRAALEVAAPELEDVTIDCPPTAPVVMAQHSNGHGGSASTGVSVPPPVSAVAVELRPKPPPTTPRSGSPAARARPSPAAVPEPLCDLCAGQVAAKHDHLVDVEDRRVVCACRACYLLFSERGAGGRRFRAVPSRCVELQELRLSAADWDSLEIPVSVAFFFRNSVLDRVAACYPGPAGATETMLPLEAFDSLAGREPLLSTLEPDVEAVLIRHSREADDAFIVPITACYELVGELRRRWRGFDGGSEARAELDGFFDRLRSRDES